MAGCGGPNGLPPGVNLGGAIGGGFVQPERLPELNHHDFYRGSLEWSYQPPSRLASAFKPSFELAPLTRMEPIFPKLESLWATPKLELWEPEQMFVPKGCVKRLGDLGLLDFSDK